MQVLTVRCVLSGKLPQVLAPLIAAGVLSGAQPAKAILSIYVYEDALDVKVEVAGSLSQLSAPTKTDGSCGLNGAFTGALSTANNSTVCTGPDINLGLNLYSISGPANYGGGNFLLAPSTTVAGDPFWFAPSGADVSSGYVAKIGLPNSNVPGGPYVLGNSFSSSATFAGQTLASLGFTTPGLIGTWTLDGTSESIRFHVGPPPPPTPGPLPLLGASAVFGFGRRLRRRLRQGGPGCRVDSPD